MTKNIPEIRFPEFEVEWENEKINNMFIKVRNGFVGTATPYYVDEAYKEKVKYLQGKNIKNGKLKLDELVYVKKSFSDQKKNSILKLNDLLMVQSGHIGDVAVVKEIVEGANCHAILIFSPKKNRINSEFVKNLFLSDIGKKEIYKITTGNTVKHILSSDVKEIKIKKPSLPEQQKIADFFSTLDTRIQIQEDKIKNLEEQKKGYTQRIFSQEIRFKDENGEDYPEWEEKRFEELGEFFNGLSGKNKDDFEEGNKKYITYMSVFSNPVTTKNSYGFVSMKPEESQNRVEYGDVLFTQSSETLEEVGMTSVWTGDGEIYLNSFCFGFRFRSLDKISPVYVGYLLRSDNLRRMISREGQGSTRFNLSSNRLKGISIPLPFKEEQEKIANFLSLFNEKIEIEKKILETLQDLKRGFLQKMFV